MKIVTAQEMRSIDAKTIKGYGIPGAVLMERAGLSVSRRIQSLFDKKKVVVLSGGGNNGGDGLVVARSLCNQGWNVKVLMVSKKDRLGSDCLEQFKINAKLGIPNEFRSRISEKDLHGAIVVDSLLGTGINKAVKPPMSRVIAFLNKSAVPVVSVDIPSGISSDNGQVMGEAVRADYTVTFGLPKIGHVLFPGADFAGTLFVEDIGFPQELLVSDSLKVQTSEKQDAVMRLPVRTRFSHKGDYGHVLVVSGSRGKTGAAFMAASACLRSGAGMVTIGVPETLADIFQGRVTEEMVLPLPDTGRGTLSDVAHFDILEFLNQKADILAIGPGIGVSEDTVKIVAELITKSTSPLVIDADGINSVAAGRLHFKHIKAPVIMTPHIGEMARLLGRKTDTGKLIEQEKVTIAQEFSKKSGTHLVLKGVPTVIADPGGEVYINTTGNPGMATAGSGDVLTGMIASFVGQGLNPFDASVLGTYMHGLAGDIGASEKGMHSLIASDIIEKLPNAFSFLRGNGRTHLP